MRPITVHKTYFYLAAGNSPNSLNPQKSKELPYLAFVPCIQPRESNITLNQWRKSKDLKHKISKCNYPPLGFISTSMTVIEPYKLPVGLLIHIKKQ